MNILIVESKNDRHFVEAVIRHLRLQTTVQVNPATICKIDDFDCLNSLSLPRLTASLSSLFARVRKEGIEKIGIMLDMDTGLPTQLQLVNDAIRQAASNVFNVPFENEISEMASFSSLNADAVTTVDIACYFTNVEGIGELETVLKTIKTQDSPYADCLQEWQQCLQTHEKTISPKEFDKFRLNNYIRFDTCSNRERRQSERKCSMQNFDYVLENKPHIFNYDHEVLEDLKRFLNLFV